ncbi:signal recognition particle receptor subunit alpha homolog [Juglans microcarpa x Juglans regia]|uniref:signal recognition particle receptor subunit alpha homolog n=1 Tax=Juglans microcarpa x Juglans regia TaxID=2249226 RepID=UPI001B7E913B|nr:signal recognition particle receptor subunit alpha homolog [Juglans microcarpa x Juglans regia]
MHVRVFLHTLVLCDSCAKAPDSIFEKGFEKDPAIVAKEAIREATHNGSDVVLVDTAGQMQDNEPLMRALSKLIYLNNPELVLFVGEALVGNDAVDQLSKFDQKLADLSTSASPRLIDGILLTKFDTIDDKVGATLSMVCISGEPVMSVGCEQSYTDLKMLNVKSIVKTMNLNENVLVSFFMVCCVSVCHSASMLLHAELSVSSLK